MTITLALISPSDIERGMVLASQIVVGTTYLEDYDVIEVELASPGPRILFPLDSRLILITGDGPRPKLLRDWPADVDSSAERRFQLRLKRRASGVTPRRATTSVTHDKFDWSDEELARHIETGH